MRGAPQSWFSVLICLISARNSISIRGRPPREFDFQRQKRRKPVRCQCTSVSGRTIVTTSRINGNHRYIWTRNQRSFVREMSSALHLTSQDHQLMSERGILSLKPDFRLEPWGQDRHDETKEPDNTAT